MKKTLKQIREEAGKSKLKMSKDLGIPYTTYQRYESNLGAASFETVVGICNKLGITTTEIAC